MVFFDCYGIVHHEFAPEGKTVNAAFYVEVLKRLRDHVWPELWEGKQWILHHDSVLYTAVYSPGPGRERILDVTLDGNEVRYSVEAQRWKSLTLVTAQKLAS